ncbi:hypothetical protein D3C77_149200 [compost metagenome]
MAVDLRALPDKQTLPGSPVKGRWYVVILLCAVLGAALISLLWPEHIPQMTLWYWACVVVVPLTSGLLLFALRHLIYERQYDYVQSWNLSRNEQEQVLIQDGQRRVAMLATSYCTAAGSNQLAQALRNGSKPLQPVFLEQSEITLRVSQLTPAAQVHTAQEYSARLKAHFHQVMGGLDKELQQFVRTAPLYVRIKHNQILSDGDVLSLWEEYAQARLTVDQVDIADDDGLLWLDAWLDKPESNALYLSLEINLFQEPIAEHAESVSAVLLAQAHWCASEKREPLAWIHRPVLMTRGAESVHDVLLWGRIHDGDAAPFVWQSQVPGDQLGEASIAMSTAGHPLEHDRCLSLDDSLGLPGKAVGNLALVIAAEHARAEQQPQLVMLQDATLQWGVVRPAG